MARALVPLADGVEEMEAVIVIDTLRRAKWEVVSAGIVGTTITGSRGVRLLADTDWASVHPDAFDILVLPGGRDGVQALATDRRILDATRAFSRDGKWIAAICAAPLVLQAAGLLAGRQITCHPSVRAEMTSAQAILDDRVVLDGTLITSQAAGTSFEFALAIIRQFDGPEAADSVAATMML